MSVKFKSFFIAGVLLISAPSFALSKSIVPIQKWVTSKGTPVLYVYERELPIVDIQVVFDAGSARDANTPGLAKITNDTLDAGTQGRNADQIATAFDDVGALYSAAVNRDMAVVALRSLSDPKFFDPAFATFSDVLTSANFPAHEFTRIQKQTLSSLSKQDETPSSIASKAFYNAVFDDNPYGHPVSGTITSVSHFTAEDLKNFYKTFYTASNAMITIVGDIDQKRAAQLAENLSSKMIPGQKLSAPSVKQLALKQQFKHIAFPSSQTHVLIGQTGINRNDPGYFPVVVGNYILGGGSLTSRLFDEVREKRGLAYDVRSQFSALKDKGPFVIELQVRNSEAQNAIKVVNDTVKNFVVNGPSANEMNLAKRNLVQGFILRLASNTAIIAQLNNIGFYQLPLNYLDTYQANINKVTDASVKKEFQRVIQPNQLVTVTVGSESADKNGKKAL